MKKTIIITLILIILAVGIANAFHQVGASYDALYYYGGGGLIETTATQDIGAGIGQVQIGEINNMAYNVAIYYGIFYVNVTYTTGTSFFLPVALYIEDFGIEWVKLNWTF